MDFEKVKAFVSDQKKGLIVGAIAALLLRAMLIR